MNPGPPPLIQTILPLTKTRACGGGGAVDHQYSNKGPLALYKDAAYAYIGHAPFLIPRNRNNQARILRPDIRPEYPDLGGYTRSWVNYS